MSPAGGGRVVPRGGVQGEPQGQGPGLAVYATSAAHSGAHTEYIYLLY